MNEDVTFLMEMTKDSMTKVIAHLESELVKIRAGKANPGMLDGIMVDYYGVNTPLGQAANVSTPDPRTIVIQPWDKSMIEPIEKAIMVANLGFNPLNNGELIRINVPALTEERRKELAKQVKGEGESSKVVIRNARRDANEELKKMKKDGLSEDNAKDAEIEVQKLTDDFVKDIDKVLDAKEAEIMTV